jgi:hypothetical protein
MKLTKLQQDNMQLLWDETKVSGRCTCASRTGTQHAFQHREFFGWLLGLMLSKLTSNQFCEKHITHNGD